jgi:hypothetical protein
VGKIVKIDGDYAVAASDNRSYGAWEKIAKIDGEASFRQKGAAAVAVLLS